MLIRKRLLKYYMVKEFLDLIKKNSYAGLYKLNTSDLLTSNDPNVKFRDTGLSEKITIALNNANMLGSTVEIVKEELIYVLNVLYKSIIDSSKANIDKIHEVNSKVESLQILIQSTSDLKLGIYRPEYINKNVEVALRGIIESKKLDKTPKELISYYGNSITNTMLMFDVIKKDITTVLNANKSFVEVLKLDNEDEVRKVLISSIIDIYKNELKDDYIFNIYNTTYTAGSLVSIINKLLNNNKKDKLFIDVKQLEDSKEVVIHLINSLGVDDDLEEPNMTPMLLLSSLFSKLEVLNEEIDTSISDVEDTIIIVSTLIANTTD